MTNDLHSRLTEAAAESARIAGAVRPEQLDDRTPCTDYDVRTLANHLVLWTSHNLRARARGEILPEEMQQRDFTAEPGWAADYRAQLDVALAAWSDPVVWERDLDMAGTSMPATEIARMMLMELALHGWDLARATAQDYNLPEPTARAVLSAVEEYAGMYRQYKGFAEQLPIPGTTGTFDRALALSGRDPRWSA
jgi:uncharacterized protein (TIGR03086 family)